MSECNTLAYGWHLQRLDGVMLGFTSHDRDQLLDGVYLSAQPGLAPTKVTSSLGTQSDGLDISGALTSDALREDDFQNGRWNGANMHIFLYDWNDLDAPTFTLSRGQLGEVSRSNESFTAEFLGLTSQLDNEVAPLTSPNCRARFGDHHCKINKERFTHEAIVLDFEGNRLILKEALPGALGRFSFGELRWLSGEMTGLSTYILESDANSLSLIDIPPDIAGLKKDLGEGETLDLRIEIIMGCLLYTSPSPRDRG